MGRMLLLEYKFVENRFPELNCLIALDQVNKIINKTKRNKSVGIGGIPYEVMKNVLLAELLSKLFNPYWIGRTYMSLPGKGLEGHTYVPLLSCHAGISDFI